MRSHAEAWERSETSRMNCACGRVRRAHHVFSPHCMRSRPPSLACACREPRRKVQRRTIFFGAHGALYRRWSRAAGVAAFLHADFATAWGARLLLPFGDGVWRAGGGRQGRVRAVVPAGQSLADGSAPFFTRFASKAAEGLFARNKHAGRGGRPPPSRHSRPDPVAPGRQPIIPWKNGGPAFTVTIFPSCCVSAPPLCRKAPLST